MLQFKTVEGELRHANRSKIAWLLDRFQLYSFFSFSNDIPNCISYKVPLVQMSNNQVMTVFEFPI